VFALIVAGQPLARVTAKLDPLLPKLGPYLQQLGGTFAARAIAGTDRKSAHAWGIAIDIDPRASDYWRNMPGTPVWKHRVPPVLVEAFESEGWKVVSLRHDALRIPP